MLGKKALEFYELTGVIPPMGGGKGGGGVGGQTTQTVQKADPWSGQQPYLEFGFEKAQDRYNSDQPNFFPGNTISPFNANEMAYQQGVVDYTTGGRPAQMSAGAENLLNNEAFGDPNSNQVLSQTRGLANIGTNALNRSAQFTDSPILDASNTSPIMQQMLSGSVARNPFIGDSINAFANDTVSNFQQQVMPALRASQTAYQPGGSSRGDIASGIAAGNVGRSIADFSNRARMEAFNSAQQQQMGAAQLLEGARGQRANEALGQAGGAFNPALGGESVLNSRMQTGFGAYPTVVQTPVDILGNQGDVGFAQRELAQQNLDQDVNRFMFDQNIEDQKLSNYMNLIQGNYGGTSVNSAERGGTGLAGSLVQGLGGAAALGGLLGM